MKTVNKNSKKATLKGVAVVRMDKTGYHFMKVHGPTRAAYVPLDDLQSPSTAVKTLAKRFGILTSDEAVDNLKATQSGLPRLAGVSRLGWTDERDAFFYGDTNLVPSEKAKYDFVAAKSTVKAFQPHGDRERQYAAFKQWWQDSWCFRLLLSLVAVSPILEVMGSPIHQFHLAGPSGIGKSTLIRLALSALGDPTFMSLDSSKDTDNYADAKLGDLHNFPLLLDETTLGRDGLLARAYAIAVGHTKNRLAGPDQNYRPVDGIPYTLVCFLAGEQSIKADFDHKGGVARLMEMEVGEQLVPKAELDKWFTFASQHYGYVGRDLMVRALRLHRDSGLTLPYVYYNRLTKKRWPDQHSRTSDFLAAVQVGYRLAGATVLGTDTGDTAAQEFAREVNERLNSRSKADELLDAMRGTPGVTESAKQHGFIPLGQLDGVATDLSMKRKDLVNFLKDAGLVSTVGSRKIKDVGGNMVSVKSAILTPEGTKRLVTTVTTVLE